MARRRKEKPVVDEATKKRLRQLRSAERREERKKQRVEEADVGPVDVSWILRDLTMVGAMRIVNADKTRPYWLSIPFAQGDGNPPVSEFFPCSSFRTKERTYYGFLFRQHREAMMTRVDEGRRELTDTVRRMNPAAVG